MAGNNLLNFLIVLTLFGCNASTNKDTINALSNDGSGVTGNLVNEKEPEVTVERKSDYSEEFVKGLKQIAGYRKFVLKDSLFIVDDTDTIYFPQIPRIGKRIVLTGRKDSLAVAVTVKRFNYTTVDYKIEMVGLNGTNYQQSGQANIISSFFLGSESNESEGTGIEYFVTEFIDSRDNGCNTFIRLGVEEETGPYLLGTLKKNCNGKIQDLTLNNFTTLMEKWR
jgi:hypothetical protein